jgi:hypothetical protein
MSLLPWGTQPVSERVVLVEIPRLPGLREFNACATSSSHVVHDCSDSSASYELHGVAAHLAYTHIIPYKSRTDTNVPSNR